MMFPMTSTDLSKIDLGVREDLQDDLRLSMMYFSMSKMTLPVMKMDVMSHCGGVESLPQMAQACLLCYHVKIRKRIGRFFGMNFCSEMF